MALDGAGRRAAVLAATVLIAGCSSGGRARPVAGTGHGRPAAPVRLTGEPVGNTGQPVLSDDFGGTRLDTRKWEIYNAPDARTHPGVNTGTHVADGHLVLVGGLYKGRDQSAGVISRLAQTYGRWEARIRSDPGPGYSATAFLWPTHLGEPEWSEIDFAEILAGNRRSGGLFIHHGKDDRQVQKTIRADFTQWHTVAVDWLPDHVTFWLDGAKYWTYQGSFVPKRSDMHLYLRNERRNGFHRTEHTPAKTTMQVDWIRVFRNPATR